MLVIPIHGDDPASVTVHVALNPPDRAEAVIREALYGVGVALTMPDLFAHKGYCQMPQYDQDSAKRIAVHSRITVRDWVREPVS
jgi:hypothetical protein